MSEDIDGIVVFSQYFLAQEPEHEEDADQRDGDAQDNQTALVEVCRRTG